MRRLLRLLVMIPGAMIAGCAGTEARLGQVYEATQRAPGSAYRLATKHEAVVDDYDSEARSMALRTARADFQSKLLSDSRPTDVPGIMRAYDETHGDKGLKGDLALYDAKRKAALNRAETLKQLWDTKLVAQFAANFKLSYEQVQTVVDRLESEAIAP